MTPDGSTQLVFWKGAGNILNEAWYTGNWNGPITFPQLGAMSSTPSVAVTKDGSTQLVFWEGPGGHLYEAWYTGSWNGPVDWTGAWGGRGLLASAPSVVTTRDGEQLVYWRGTDGHLWEAWYTGAWNGPADFSNLGTLASAPSATITPDSTQQLVFYQGVDNRLTEVWFTGTWHGPVEFTALGTISSPPSVVVSTDGSTQLVFYRSSSGDLLEVVVLRLVERAARPHREPVRRHSAALTSSPSAAVTPDGTTQLVFWQGAGQLALGGVVRRRRLARPCRLQRRRVARRPSRSRHAALTERLPRRSLPMMPSDADEGNDVAARGRPRAVRAGDRPGVQLGGACGSRSSRRPPRSRRTQAFDTTTGPPPPGLVRGSSC